MIIRNNPLPPNIPQPNKTLTSSISNGMRKTQLSESIKNPTKISFGGLASPKPDSKMLKWFCKSQGVKWALEKAVDKQLIFDAGFALFLTCILRPASIMVLPSKKNQDDQKYASAHSIGSGIIGFAISNILFTPISNAIKKIKDHPEDFIKEKSYLKTKESFDIAKKYIDRLPDIVGSVPKGILTIALIPPILKYIFGWEKKKPEAKTASTPQIIKGGVK